MKEENKTLFLEDNFNLVTTTILQFESISRMGNINEYVSKNFSSSRDPNFLFEKAQLRSIRLFRLRKLGPPVNVSAVNNKGSYA